MNEVVLGKRKIVLQGKFSHMIALPKEFCVNNGWEVGKEVIIKTDGERLILELVEE
jgi:hypothetical protein